MKKLSIAIITDSGCDLNLDFLKEYDIEMIPQRICFGEKTYRSGFDIKDEDIYDMMKEQIPESSLPAHQDILNAFENLVKKGYKEAIYIGISSGLSGSFNFISMLAQEFKDLKIHCFDTKTLSCGQNLILKKTIESIENNYSVEEIFTQLQNVREKMHEFFVVKDLTYLIKGGRINKAGGLIGSMLRINPVVGVTEEGTYKIMSKAIGFNRATENMVNLIGNLFEGKKTIAAFTFAAEKELAKNLKEKICSKIEVIEDIINPVTAVLGVHTGPGMCGLAVYSI